MTHVASPTPSLLGLWWMAARPKTLTAAVAPVMVGTATALYVGQARPWVAAVALLGAFLIQIGTNFANDYFDHIKGADTDDRLGPTRVTQAGLIPPEQVRAAMVLTFAAAVAVGAVLVWVGGWPIVAIGVASVISGVAYTGGPYPLGYHGLGDVFVFVFFGVIAVVATDFLQTGTWSLLALAASVPIGALSTAILVVNNLRDAPTDARAGKRTLAVRFGESFAVAEYVALLVLAYGGTLAMAVVLADPWLCLPWLSLPLAWRMLHSVRNERGRPLNATLGGTARLLAVFGVLLSVGLVLAR